MLNSVFITNGPKNCSDFLRGTFYFVSIVVSTYSIATLGLGLGMKTTTSTGPLPPDEKHTAT